MTTKLSFRSRQLDPSKPMPIYRAEEVPDLGECTAISRGVPILPSGMEKEEEGVSTFAYSLALLHARSQNRRALWRSVQCTLDVDGRWKQR